MIVNTGPDHNDVEGGNEFGGKHWARITIMVVVVVMVMMVMMFMMLMMRDDGDDDDDGAGGKHRSMVTAHCSRKSLEKTAGGGRSCFW